MKIEKLLFTEKYRPRNLDDVVIPDSIKKIFTTTEIPNLLLYGSPGTGKTSLAKAYVKHYDLPNIYINASKETGVEIIRTRIADFCSTQALTYDSKKLKIVILDEIDGASQQFFKAFKASMEEFHMTSRFIATSNYINKLDDAIISRFDTINFDFDKEEYEGLIKSYFMRLWKIAKNEGMTFEKEAMFEMIRKKFPDMRSMLNTMQSLKKENLELIKIENVKRFASIYKDIYKIIFNTVDPITNYKLLMSDYANRCDEVLNSLGTEFIEYIVSEQHAHMPYIPKIIKCVKDNQAIRYQVIDSNIVMLSTIYELQTIVNTK